MWLQLYHICNLQLILTILKYFEERKWITPLQQVLKRKVDFIKNTDDAMAEICLVEEANDGNIELVGNKKVCYTY